MRDTQFLDWDYLSQSEDPAFCDLYIDDVLMGHFLIEPNVEEQIGLKYSLRRIWDNKLELVRIDGRRRYYRRSHQ